ncbi:hypothetical protein KY308_01940 [Candidatus Woesearchaeota archaeon]|nr:hypothetical protein [Candidatus Woesearchaeota archaeon]
MTEEYDSDKKEEKDTSISAFITGVVVGSIVGLFFWGFYNKHVKKIDVGDIKEAGMLEQTLIHCPQLNRKFNIEGKEYMITIDENCEIKVSEYK